MNLKEIEYIVKIDEERNVTRAAEKLFITPSALNQQLLRLERDIGTPLFYRSRTGWTPTEAGMVYLDTAREMLRLKRETYHRLQDIAAAKKGTLSIGFPPERGASMFTNVYPDFHREYPDIIINVSEVSVRRQQQMIACGDLDIGFMTLRENQQTEDEYIKITSEELILAIPAVHPLCSRAVAAGRGPYPELDIRELRYEPFALMYRESTIRECADGIFRQAGFIPNVLFETSRARTIIDIVAAQMCCGLVPYTDSLHAAEAMRPHGAVHRKDATLPEGAAHRKDAMFPKGAAFFCLPGHPTWNLAASYRKGSYLSHPARRLIDLASDYWRTELTDGSAGSNTASP